MAVESGRIESALLKNSKFYVDWQVASRDITNNYTVINWQAGLNIANNNAWYSNAIRIDNITLDGYSIFGGGTYSNLTTNGDHQLASGQATIYHNTDGSKTFTLAISGWLYSRGNTSGSGSFELTSIPRQATITGAIHFYSNQNPYMEFSNPREFAYNMLYRIWRNKNNKRKYP